MVFIPGELATYNLEVEGVHDTFAGGYLVHDKTTADVCLP